MLKFTIVLLALFFVSANAIDVKFCSEPNFEGSCATKSYDSYKCEHLPWRFRWIYNVRSVKVKSNFFGICNSECELHTSERCGRQLFGGSFSVPFACERPILKIKEGEVYRGMICNGGGLLGK